MAHVNIYFNFLALDTNKVADPCRNLILAGYHTDLVVNRIYNYN